MKHEAVVYTTVGMTRQLPRVSPYKAVGNAAAAVSRLLQHSSELRVTKSDAAIDTLHAPATTTVSPVLCCTQWDDRQNLHVMLSTVEWKEGLNISYSQVGMLKSFI